MPHRAARRLIAAGVAVAAAVLADPGRSARRPTRPADYQDDDGPASATSCRPAPNGFAPEVGDISSHGTRPPHNNDQLDEYDDLVQAPAGTHRRARSTASTRTRASASSGDLDYQYTPDCADHLRAVAELPALRRRDDRSATTASGSRTSTAPTAPPLMFGAGYVGAEDRLFFMDVERHVGRAELSDFLGGSNTGTDRTNLALRPVHRGRPAGPVRQRRRALRRRRRPGPGATSRTTSTAINQYIAEAIGRRWTSRTR